MLNYSLRAATTAARERPCAPSSWSGKVGKNLREGEVSETLACHVREKWSHWASDGGTALSIGHLEETMCPTMSAGQSHDGRLRSLTDTLT